MKSLRFLLVAILSFQLSTYVVADTADVQNALNELDDLIQSSSKVVSTTASELWTAYTTNISDAFHKYFAQDVENLLALVDSIVIILNNAGSGKECIDLLLGSDGYVEDLLSPEDLIFSNLIDVATAELSNSESHYADLKSQFVTNCIDNKINCEGTSEAVLREAQRQLAIVQRIPFELLTEIHLLGYKLEIHLESAHTSSVEIYNRAIQNVSACISAKIMESTQDFCKSCDMVHPEDQVDVNEAYKDLLAIIEFATLNLPELLQPSYLQADSIISQEYHNATDAIYALDSRVANVISSLLRTAEDYNVTLTCRFLALPTAIETSLGRVASEFDLLRSDLQKRYYMAIGKMVNIIEQAEAISLEMEGCSRVAYCDYLLEKIISTEFQVLWKVEQLAYSSAVTFAQTVTTFRESGARTIREAVEQLQVGMTYFKNCVQFDLE